jgi:hypothetical protein
MVRNRDIIHEETQVQLWKKSCTVLPDVHSYAEELSSIAYLSDRDLCGFHADQLSFAICQSQNIVQRDDEFAQTRTQYFSVLNSDVFWKFTL